MAYIHELKAWPGFRWNQERLAEKLYSVHHRQGRLIGRMEALGFKLRAEATLETLTEDVIKSSEIEGEVLDRNQVRSSIARRLGMDIGALTPADRNVEGVVEMMLDATQKFPEPLSAERLFGWHGSLFPTGRSGMTKIKVAAWRDDTTGPMQVVSGPIGRERVHYEAPAADRLDLYEAAVHWLAAPASSGDRFAFAPTAFRFHSRPSLKIQDGCDNRCAYCRVCLARGPSVSLEPTRLLERVRALEAAGAPEIVLTGVNLSQYRAVGLDFSALLGWLLAETDRVAFRISSWEPDRVDDAFLAVFLASRVRPHLHLAAQSGSDVTLRAMGRHYGAARLLAAVADLRRVKVDPFLGADLICGFPGETDAQFGQTLALAEQADFAWIHAYHPIPKLF